MVVLAFALIAAACGGGDSDESGAASSTTAVAVASSTTTPHSGDAAEDQTTTTAATSAAGEGAESAYCMLAAETEFASDALSDLNLPAEEFNQRSIEAALPYFDELAALAPDDISVDMEAFVELFREYAVAVERASWDVENLDEEGNELNSELFDYVFELAVYDGEVCGVGDFADDSGEGLDDQTDTTTIDTVPAATTTVADSDDLGDALTPEEIDELMSNPEERAFQIGVWVGLGLTEEQAECVARGVLALPDVDDIDAVDAVLAGCGA